MDHLSYRVNLHFSGLISLQTNWASLLEPISAKCLLQHKTKISFLYLKVQQTATPMKWTPRLGALALFWMLVPYLILAKLDTHFISGAFKKTERTAGRSVLSRSTLQTTLQAIKTQAGTAFVNVTENLVLPCLTICSVVHMQLQFYTCDVTVSFSQQWHILFGMMAALSPAYLKHWYTWLWRCLDNIISSFND